MHRSLPRRRLECLGSAQSVFLEQSVRPGAVRPKRLSRIRSQPRLQALRAWVQLQLTKRHAHPRKAKAAQGSGNGSSPRRITALQPSQPTLSAGRETWLSDLQTAHSGTVPTQTAASACLTRWRVQQPRRPPKLRNEAARMDLAPAESGLQLHAFVPR